jgi:hypothetical protein
VTTRVKSSVCHSPPPGTFVWGPPQRNRSQTKSNVPTYIPHHNTFFPRRNSCLPSSYSSPDPNAHSTTASCPGLRDPDSTTRRPKATAWNRKSWSKQRAKGGKNCGKKICNKNHGSDTNEATLAETETMDRRHDGEADDADERNREQTPRAPRPNCNFPTGRSAFDLNTCSNTSYGLHYYHTTQCTLLKTRLHKSYSVIYRLI